MQLTAVAAAFVHVADDLLRLVTVDWVLINETTHCMYMYMYMYIMSQESINCDGAEFEYYACRRPIHVSTCCVEDNVTKEVAAAGDDDDLTWHLPC